MKLLTRIQRSWRRLPLRVQGIILASTLVTGSLSVPGLVQETSPARQHKADLYFLETPPVAVGQTFTVELRAKTNGTAINSMGFNLIYNPLYLEVIAMTTEKSFCTFYLDNSFSNQKGIVKVSCGMPSPGFLGDSLAVRLTVRGKNPGTPAIVADPATVQLLANDGKGSNIVKTSPEITLNIKQL